MGSLYLTDLAGVIRAAGLTVHEHPGWKTRGRSTGGFSAAPVAIVIHHTASPPSWNGDRDANYIATGSDIAPIAQLYLDRQGVVHVLAAGACNNAGAGGPLGPLPKDGANTRTIGIEAGNNGVGEPWPTAQQDAYIRLVRALTSRYMIGSDKVYAHKEWAPTRKIDPAGPSRWADADGRWNMSAFRRDLHAAEPTHIRVPTPTLRQGSRGHEVGDLIDILKFWHWYPAEYLTDHNDGSFGTRCYNGVRNMQLALGAAVDGVYGPQSARLLTEFLTAMAALAGH